MLEVDLPPIPVPFQLVALGLLCVVFAFCVCVCVHAYHCASRWHAAPPPFLLARLKNFHLMLVAGFAPTVGRVAAGG